MPASDGFASNAHGSPLSFTFTIRVTHNVAEAPLILCRSDEGAHHATMITTKPATDTFHGELNFNFNSQWLNARDPFALRRAPVQLRDYSAVFSGPFKRNRRGYFLDLSRNEADESAVVNATILNPSTLVSQPFTTAVVTPLRDTDFSFRTNYMLSRKHQLDFFSILR
jgi:hypothetical protein